MWWLLACVSKGGVGEAPGDTGAPARDSWGEETGDTVSEDSPVEDSPDPDTGDSGLWFYSDDATAAAPCDPVTPISPAPSR